MKLLSSSSESSTINISITDIDGIHDITTGNGHLFLAAITDDYADAVKEQFNRTEVDVNEDRYLIVWQHTVRNITSFGLQNTFKVIATNTNVNGFAYVPESLIADVKAYLVNLGYTNTDIITTTE